MLTSRQSNTLEEINIYKENTECYSVNKTANYIHGYKREQIYIPDVQFKMDQNTSCHY